MAFCSIIGCDRPARKYDLCYKHHREVAPDIEAQRERLRIPVGHLPSFEQVREMLDYDLETGAFRWRVKIRRIRPGDPAGYCSKRGYVVISVGNRGRLAHRLAIFWMTGSWPPELTDHRNGQKDDNRWENIRPASPEMNAQNIREATRRSGSGYLGVSPPQLGRHKFKATIQVAGRSIHLGYHDSPEQAHAAYLEAKRQLHEGSTI